MPGYVTPAMLSKSARYFQIRSTPIVMDNGATANLVTPIGFAPRSSRIAITGGFIYNYTAISNHAMGTIKIGTAIAAGTLDDDSLLSLTNTQLNTSGDYAIQATAIHKRTRIPISAFASTLKSTKGPVIELGYPIVPAENSIVATVTGMASSGTGSVILGLFGWVLNDER